MADDYEFIPPREYRNAKRKWNLGCLVILVMVLLLIAGVIGVVRSWSWAHSAMSNYIVLNGGSKVAQVCISRTEKPGEMNVHMTLFESNGKQTNVPLPLLNGDTLLLQGDIITYQALLNNVGLYSGYKLTGLEGYYKDRHQAPILVPINNGDDDFFKQIHDRSTPAVKASYDNPLFIPADGKTYTVLLSQTGAYIEGPDQPRC